MPSNYLWLLDNGHGGVINGVYQTAGKRSPIWADGTLLYEGEFNRAVVQKIAEKCRANSIDYNIIVPENEDIPRDVRTNRANNIYESDKRCIFLSIHSNAGGGKGWEVFTSNGLTKSDKIATVFFNKAAEEFGNDKMRADHSDNDPDKEAQFDVLVDTKMPAILTENFFMDNEDECKNLLMKEEGRERIAEVHFRAIQEVERIKLI